MAYKAEAIFPITYFKAETVIGDISQKYLFCNVVFLHLSKPGEMPVTDFIFLSLPLACYFAKG